MAIFCHTNRLGVTYYVHETRTKAGARRHVIKPVAEGALAAVPEGMEVVENIHGQVSVRAVRERIILPLEEAMVQQALVTHGREKYRVETKGKDITIYDPNNDVDEGMDLFDRYNRPGFGFGVAVDKAMRERVGDAAWENYRRQEEKNYNRKREEYRQYLERRMQYSPIFRLCLSDAKRRRFVPERMSYRGMGGWKRINDSMPLSAACDRYIPLLGTDKIFETYYD